MLGERIGNYRLVRKLGEGGMGEVFEAVHEQIGRRAAVKVLRPEFSHKPELAARLFNEARAVSIIRHPGVIDISECGQTEAGTLFLVMEYLEGDSLARRLKLAGGRLPLETALRLAQQLAATLAAAHEKKIIHRDLKPDNVVLVPDPLVPGGERTKLLDFGIAKVAEDYGGTMTKTRTGSLLGTPYYMSPEQCRGARALDDKSDVYSLGVMLYQMLAGAPPFVSPGMGEVMAMHMLQAPRPVQELVPTVPPRVAELLALMLAKEPQGRPAMGQVAAELAGLLESMGPGTSGGEASRVPSFRPSVPSVPSLPPTPSTLGQSAGESGRPVQTRRNRTLFVASVGLALGLLGLGAWRQHRASRERAVVAAARLPPQVEAPPAPPKLQPSEAPARPAQPPEIVEGSGGDPAPPASRRHRPGHDERGRGGKGKKALLKQAQAAYAGGDYRKALELARAAGDTVRAWRIGGAAACNLRDPKAASDAFHHTVGRDQQYIISVCDKNGLKFVGGR